MISIYHFICYVQGPSDYRHIYKISPRHGMKQKERLMQADF